jgi:hypothetical protein
MVQVVSLVGAALILGAYVGAQLGRVQSGQPAYNAMNLVGSVLLTYVALVDQRIGFIVLEGAWAAVSLYALWRGRTHEPARS